MIDIHSHFLHCVDDGSSSIEDSLLILKQELSYGISDVILTPHFRQGMFESSIETIKKRFEELKARISSENINLNLYLGQEVYIQSINHFRSLFGKPNAQIINMNDTNYALLEFSYTEYIDILEIVHLAKVYKLIPIIAHVERYKYLGIEDIYSIKVNGGLIQINASSIVGDDGIKAKKFVKKLITNNLVDFVASDMHYGRTNFLKEAYDYSLKHFDNEIVDNIFNKNAKALLK